MEAIANIEIVEVFLHNSVAQVKDVLGITCVTNGPQGTVASKTVASVKRLESELTYMETIIGNYNLNMSVCLTTKVESLHAVSHFKDDTQTVL